MSRLKEELNKKENYLKRLIRVLEQRLRYPVKGNIKVINEKSGGVHYQIRRSNDDKYRYISPNEEHLIRTIVQRDYDQKLLKRAKKQYEAVCRLNSHYHPHQLSNLYIESGEGRQRLLTDAVLSDEEYAKRWQAQPYRRNSYPITTKEKVTTDKGEIVRSKSEKMISDKLIKYNIPYRVEEMIELSDGSFISPDFTVLNKRTREVYYIEHLGLMKSRKYRDDTIEKLNKYYTHGKQFVGHLIFTMEDDDARFDAKIMKNIILDNFI